ncbi:uncharacterized protein LOC111630309 [Centruroides sculpturatus]|uniref:uncharacterized protein LOC111630309 n=1 Tax=Centruroides sculpturatus TaxID=218467 RepID=UPI000C6CF694|nr:uncharacterized protein LOC111630309 [Centruroides sculpturatus]
MGNRKRSNSSKKKKKIREDEERDEIITRKKVRRRSTVDFGTSTWTMSEKALLLRGLRQFGFYHLDKVADFIKTKDVNEVRLHLEYRRSSLLKKHSKDKKDSKYNKKTIIQSWYEAASGEVPARFKRDDSSMIFAELFSNAAKNEPHLKPRTDSEPDIGAIYQYFADMLNGVFSADLRPTDSTIVLSLLHSLGNIINRGNFSLERAMYSGFKGTYGNKSLLCDDDDYVFNRNDSSSAAKSNNNNVVNCDNDSNATSTRSEADDTNKSDENGLNKLNENVSNITNYDSDSNIVQMQIECNPDNVPILRTETNSNTDYNEDDDDDDAAKSNNSQDEDSEMNKNTHFLWKQFQLNDPYNKNLAKKLKRTVQMFNPLHVPPVLMQADHDIIQQFC